MDTYMEKLAHRLTAQEMIKANTQAEAEALDHLKGQVKDYHEFLDQMQNLIAESTEQIRSLQNDGSEENRKTQEDIGLLFQAVNAAGEKTSEQNIQAIEELKHFVDEKFDALARAEDPDEALKRQSELEAVLVAVSAAENTSAQNRQAIEELRQFVDEKLEALLKDDGDEEQVKRQEELGMFLGAVDAAGEKTTQQNIQAIEALRSFVAEKLEELKPQDNKGEEDKFREQMARLVQMIDANSERTIRQNDAAMDELRKFVEDKFAENKSTSESIEQLRRFIDMKIQGLQEENEGSARLEQSLTGKIDETQEKMHKECVKVYRNVQAAMQEENEKQNTDMYTQLNAMKKKLLIVTIAAGVAGVAGIISLILQIMSALHIL